MAATVKLRQNQKRRWIGTSCAFIGFTGYLITKERQLWWAVLFIPLWLGGIFIGARGSDYAIGDAFLKIGFTRLRWDQILHITQSSPSQLRFETTRKKAYALYAEDFSPESWQLLLDELYRRNIPITHPEPQVMGEW